MFTLEVFKGFCKKHEEGIVVSATLIVSVIFVLMAVVYVLGVLAFVYFLSPDSWNEQDKVIASVTTLFVVAFFICAWRTK